MSATVAAVVEAMERRYDPGWAEAWDAVGLVCGDPAAEVRRVLFAVDPVARVAEEAVERGADLLVTHHPLFLRPVHGVAATTGKGRVAHRLVTAGVGLFVAHTNADVAAPGVSDALAATLGLVETGPLGAGGAEPTDKLVTFVPEPSVPAVLDALAAAGAGRIGGYDRCAFLAPGTGTFRPGAGTHPTIGRVGAVEEVAETRLEVVLPRRRRGSAVRALLAVHPYEEPAFDVYELAAAPGERGLGRLGSLPAAEPLGDFVARVAAALPATAWGMRATGDPARPVRTVAVCGGAGGELATAAAAQGADVFVTADLRHHPAAEIVEEVGLPVVDAAHWATEWPWLPMAADLLRADLEAAGTTVDCVVSTQRTDPWTVHQPALR